MKQCGLKIGMMGQVFLIAALVIVAYTQTLAQSSSSEPPKPSSQTQAAPSPSSSSSSLPSQAQCDVVKQMLFLVDVSGSMETNDRLNEAKQFALRIVKEHAAKNLLYKLISYGGSCNEVITDVDWTRDATVINAGVKGLYLRGGTPLGSALEFTIDEIKKSAYPDQTKVILLNDGANACGEVSEILTRRSKEIPCVRFISIGIELEEEENGMSSRAMQDAQSIATQTGGSYVPLKDVREIRGVSLSDSAVVVRSVAFEPRPKPQAKAQEKTDEKPQTQASASSSTQSTSASQTAAQSTGASQTASTTQAEKSQSEKPAEQGASQQTPSPQSPSTSQGASSSSQSNSAPQQNTSSQQNAPSQQSTTQSQSVTQKDSSSYSSPTQEKQSPSQATPQQSASESPSQAASQPASKPEERSVSRSANRRESAIERMQEPTKSTPQTSTRESLPSPPPTITDNGRELAVIRFPIGSAQLTWDARRSLERLAAELRTELRVHPALVIEVGGHSSREGTSEANLRLSVERAALVARYLRRQTGMREDRVRWTGYGELRPLIDDRFGRQENRRVEVRASESRQR